MAYYSSIQVHLEFIELILLTYLWYKEAVT